MANGLILGPNLLQSTFYDVSLSGGTWLPGYPVSNLATDRRIDQAQAVSANPGSTTWTVDLGAFRAIKGSAVVWHNLSRNATLDLELFDDAALTDKKAEILGSEVYREIYPLASTDFEDEEFWDGKVSEEHRAQFPVPWFEVLPSTAIGKYARFTVHDPDNADGRIRLGRQIIAGGIQPSVNFIYGSEIGITDESIRQGTLGGADYYDRRGKRRTMVLEFDFLPEDEAMSRLFDSVYQLGSTEQVFVAWDPDDTLLRHRRAMLATIERLSPLVAAAYGLTETSYILREVIA